MLISNPIVLWYLDGQIKSVRAINLNQNKHHRYLFGRFENFKSDTRIVFNQLNININQICIIGTLKFYFTFLFGALSVITIIYDVKDTMERARETI